MGANSSKGLATAQHLDNNNSSSLNTVTGTSKKRLAHDSLPDSVFNSPPTRVRRTSTDTILRQAGTRDRSSTISVERGSQSEYLPEMTLAQKYAYSILKSPRSNWSYGHNNELSSTSDTQGEEESNDFWSQMDPRSPSRLFHRTPLKSIISQESGDQETLGIESDTEQEVPIITITSPSVANVKRTTDQEYHRGSVSLVKNILTDQTNTFSSVNNSTSAGLKTPTRVKRGATTITTVYGNHKRSPVSNKHKMGLVQNENASGMDMFDVLRSPNSRIHSRMVRRKRLQGPKKGNTKGTQHTRLATLR